MKWLMNYPTRHFFGNRHYLYLMKYVALIIMLCAGSLAIGQNDCRVLIVNRAEGVALSFSTCLVGDKQIALQTDSAGYLTLPEQTQFPVQIEIFTLTCKQIITVSSCDETVSVHCPDIVLPTAHIKFMDAKDIVASAAERIQMNYPDTGFVLYGFYRNYLHINNYFRELTEARSACVFRFDESKPDVINEAYGIQRLRRTPYTLPLSEFYAFKLEDLFNQNLVYHPAFAAFNPLYIDKSIFEIDSALSTDTTWFIRYSLQLITGENHGIENYVPESFAGEGTETGYFIIHKSDLAFLTIHRESIRNPKYAYPGHNNFLHPDMRYTGEFNEGFLEIHYVKKEDAYYPVHIFHAYSNTYTYNPTNQIEWRITDYSEWWSDSITGIISKPLMTELLEYRSDFNLNYTYNPSEWDTTPNWYFVRKEQVFSDLELIGNLDQLFTNGGK